MSDSARLYSPRLLGLATRLADYPLEGEFAYTGNVRSRSCGSTLALGCDLDADGRIERIGVQVAACAIGQASAAIMAEGAQGRDPRDLFDMQSAIGSWLTGDGMAPDWPGFDAVEAALPHPGRHEALLLPWKAMASALPTPAIAR
ncbi:iron-sulfur cluster assembly scaffold protein [Erythrobacter sp.]|uniref:iron-sulfur cluster assembly scaffold protein n=1 Tax=Erythrobacter sp. TaxID=1042 RepID=UPI003C76328B